MKYCPHCGKELFAETNFCPNCNSSLGDTSVFFNLPKTILIILIGMLGVALFSLLDWIKVDYYLGSINLNLFSLWGKLGNISLLFGSAQELNALKFTIITLSILLIISFILLLVSLVKYQSKQEPTLAYWGFGLSTLVSAAFIILIIYINIQIDASLFSSLTIFPFSTFIVALVSMLALSDQKNIEVSEPFNMPRTKQLVFASLCVALGVALPLLFHIIPVSGKAFSPMHIPVLLCGFFCAWPFALLCGIVTSLLSSLLTGMPPIAMLPPMMVELAFYALVPALLRYVLPLSKSLSLPKYLARTYTMLIAAMLTGRIAYGLLMATIFKPGAYSLAIWWTGLFIETLPAILIQLALIPMLVVALRRSRL